MIDIMGKWDFVWLQLNADLEWILYNVKRPRVSEWLAWGNNLLQLIFRWIAVEDSL